MINKVPYLKRVNISTFGLQMASFQYPSMGAPSFSGRGGGGARIGQGGAISQPQIHCPLLGDSTSEVSALSADSISGEGAVRFQSIQPLGVRMYVNFYHKGGGGGGGGAIQSRRGTPMPSWV